MRDMQLHLWTTDGDVVSLFILVAIWNLKRSDRGRGTGKYGAEGSQALPSHRLRPRPCFREGWQEEQQKNEENKLHRKGLRKETFLSEAPRRQHRWENVTAVPGERSLDFCSSRGKMGILSGWRRVWQWSPFSGGPRWLDAPPGCESKWINCCSSA